MGQAPRDFELRNCERSEGQEGFVASSYGRLCNTSPAASMPELGRVGPGRIGAVTFSVAFSAILPATPLSLFAASRRSPSLTIL